MKILVTCPPMLGMKDEFIPLYAQKGVHLVCPDVVQTMNEQELIERLPDFDGWVIGDDPATREVFRAGQAGRLKAAVKWGIGIDNVDFAAAREFGVEITNTPDMFGAEVADMALAYVIGLARQMFLVDRGVRSGLWPKPCGSSLSGKTAVVVGFGDIGKHTVTRLQACGMHVIVHDPAYGNTDMPAGVQWKDWPHCIAEGDFLVLTCSLTDANRHMLNAETLGRAKRGVRIVNVARGPLIDERALEDALANGQVMAVALDVFEQEPLPEESPLLEYEQCILGAHNASNTAEAVRETSLRAMSLLLSFLGHSG